MKTKKFFYALSAILFVVLVGTSLYVADVISLPWQSKFSHKETFSQHLALARLKKSGKYVLIDEKEKIVSPQVDRFLIDPSYYVDSLVPYSAGGFRGYFNLYTLVDQIPSKYNRYLKCWIFDHDSGLAAVLNADTKKIGFIDKTGAYRIKPTIHYEKDYDYVFSKGECVVPDSLGNRIIINSQGKKKIDLAFSEVGDLTNGVRVVAKQDSEHGVFGILKESSLFLPLSYDDITLQDNVIVLRKGQKQWSVDYNLRTVNPFVFDNFYNLEIHRETNFCHPIDQSEFDDSDEYESEENEENDENSDISITHSQFYIVEVDLKKGLFDFKNQRYLVPPLYDEIFAVGQDEKSFSLWGIKDGFSFPLKLE